MTIITSNDTYPTRVFREETIIPRKEPVVYNAGQRHDILSQQELNFFEENGFLVKEGILKDKVDSIIDEMSILKETLRGKPELIIEPEGDIIRSVFSPDLYSDLCSELSRNKYLLGAAEQILDSDVYIHHSRINVKAGLNGKSFPWHSDFETWHAEDGVPKMRILTGWVFLTENNEFNGSLFAIPQSHKYFVSCVGETPKDNYKMSLRNQVFGVPSQETLTQFVNDFGLKAIYGSPGTVVFHEGNLLHGSPDNLSPIPRTNLFFVYNSVHNLPQEPFCAPKPRPSFLARPFADNLKM